MPMHIENQAIPHFFAELLQPGGEYRYYTDNQHAGVAPACWLVLMSNCKPKGLNPNGCLNPNKVQSVTHP